MTPAAQRERSATEVSASTLLSGTSNGQADGHEAAGIDEAETPLKDIPTVEGYLP